MDAVKAVFWGRFLGAAACAPGRELERPALVVVDPAEWTADGQRDRLAAVVVDRLRRGGGA